MKTSPSSKATKLFTKDSSATNDGIPRKKSGDDGGTPETMKTSPSSKATKLFTKDSSATNDGIPRKKKKSGDDGGTPETMKTSPSSKATKLFTKDSSATNDGIPRKKSGDDGGTPERTCDRSCSQHEDHDMKPTDDTLPPPPIVVPDPPDDGAPQGWLEEEETPSVPGKCLAWVQCANPPCMKWRRLHEQVDPWTLPEDWSCDQNPDGVYDRCDVAEESCYGVRVIDAEYVPGSIVWVKQQGRPWWPAIVDYDPDTRQYVQVAKSQDLFSSRYHVTFLGELMERAWVSRYYLKPFQQFSDNMRGEEKDRRVIRDLELSVSAAHGALSMGIQDRIQYYGSSARYKEEVKEDKDRRDVCPGGEVRGGEEITCPPVPPQDVISTAGKRRLKRKNVKCCC
ncbi:zinc finger CW-type PWWP domain protein 1-like isoform X2 [Hyla sarda]|uniref:zinc finger CW-type PWWP domain protein 1-like isoform X2 n=1 Tax=Hyla sarda TaxID=327740 RepID=UPI0024C2FC28|nr:zinc finger CW-type PWWP domain protein 1-like isoform X2 [Hyla sarda]